VIKVVPADVVTAEDYKDIFDIRISSGEIRPFARLDRRSDQLDNFNLSIRPRALYASIDLPWRRIDELT
jgi:hypothetical protein